MFVLLHHWLFLKRILLVASQEEVFTWTMKALINVIRSSHLTMLSDKIENFENIEEQKDKQINSEWEAKAAAFRIFKNVAKPSSRGVIIRRFNGAKK
ncbi:Mechanosensitive ion channel protein 4 [Carex littledalei]|uniref:Mechanosensitive ion channel protein 4 n=1 Tax=Carex littledalei TaxID=544730 RepID=A0A833QML3_9POAL|nr:Mechanosensitive ion channel protein 4 [Carex littledalei]